MAKPLISVSVPEDEQDAFREGQQKAMEFSGLSFSDLMRRLADGELITSDTMSAVYSREALKSDKKYVLVRLN